MTPLTFEGFGALISEIMGVGGGGRGGGGGIILTYPDSYKTDRPEEGGWSAHHFLLQISGNNL